MNGDTSVESVAARTHPDISLGSTQSSFLSPQKHTKASRLQSGSSLATQAGTSSAPIPTSSPPTAPIHFQRRQSTEETPLPAPHSHKMAFLDEDEMDQMPDTPAPPRMKRGRSSIGGAKGATNLTLREQEKVIDAVKKENFNLKLKVHFLEERLSQLAPDHYEAALKQNISLKLEVHARGVEMKKYKKLLLELERELERKAQPTASSSRERDLEARLERAEQELRDLRKRKGGNITDDVALREAHARNEDLNQRQAQLEDELDNAKALLEENMDEMDRLKDALERKGEGSMVEGEGRRGRLERKVAELENVNRELQAQLADFEDLVAQRDDEKDHLQDEVERLMLEAEDYQRRHEVEVLERSQSRADFIEEREDREALENDLNTTRDKLAATTIELQQREEDYEGKCEEIDELVQEHERIVQLVENQWRGEVEEARQQVEELRDVLAERDSVAAELRLQISELEANTSALHDKFEQALAHLEQESDEKDAEIEAANLEIERLSERVWELEENEEKMQEEEARRAADEAAEKERFEATVAALKEKLASTKAQLQDMTHLSETCRQEIVAHRSREEELARHVEDVMEERRLERDAREQAEEELSAIRRQREEEARRDRRALTEKESALQSALHDLSLAKKQLVQRESDLAELQSALNVLETESKKIGETHTSDRFSMELELDRLKRDLVKAEEELTRMRKELGDREAKNNDRETVMDRLHAENRDLVSQLATQTQARLNVSDKLDNVQASFRTADSELTVLRSRVAELETRLSKDQRSSLSTEHQYRDQLTERNTLLLTIYQYMDKILGLEKAPKGSQAETKPFTNFNVFHDNLISRMKALSQIQLDFDRQCKAIEGRFVEKLGDVKKQLDFRWKQIDRFESSVKSLVEVKHSWRRKYNLKEGELDTIKTTNAELVAQVSALRRAPNTDASEIRSLTVRATNAERRLANAQNQLLSTEEKMAAMNEKTTLADNKWEARVKEYESRLRAAEERVKRERQGAKERVGELESTVKNLQKQIEQASKRNQQLQEVVQTSKIPDTR